MGVAELVFLRICRYPIAYTAREPECVALEKRITTELGFYENAANVPGNGNHNNHTNTTQEEDDANDPMLQMAIELTMAEARNRAELSSPTVHT